MNIGLVLGAIGLWFPYPDEQESIRIELMYYMELSTEEASWLNISLSYRIVGFVITLVPAYMLLCSLEQARKMLNNFARGHILAIVNAMHLRQMARLITGFSLCCPLAKLLTGLALTINNPPSQRLGMLYMDLAEIILLGLGLILWTLSWAIVEAARAIEENNSFI